MNAIRRMVAHKDDRVRGLPPDSNLRPQDSNLRPLTNRLSKLNPMRGFTHSPTTHDKMITEYTESSIQSDVIKESRIPEPELSSGSHIMTYQQIIQINESLPARAQCRCWSLVYSTAEHGFSLMTLYNRMTNIHSPTLLVISDSSDKVFGAFLSTNLYVCNKVYGSGESFLFSFDPEYRTYRWSGEDNHIIKADQDCVSVGHSGGAHGLWLDCDLYRGRSERCRTFNNEPLASQLDFTVSNLEAWAFD